MRHKYDRAWFGRRFLDFRQGHALYLAFFVNFVTFGTVVYALAIERVEFLKAVFPNMLAFFGFFVLIYIPVAVLIGDWHMKNQQKIEARKGIENNPYTWHAQQGKESLFNLPSGATGLELQKKGMLQQNKIAETLALMIEQQNNIVKALNAIRENEKIPILPELADPLIPKFTEQEFEKVEYWRRVTIYLKEGMNVKDALINAGNSK